MNFIPKKIKVGYQERHGTYTGKLAYVIYFDEKGKLRKEASWQSWRDNKIEPQEFENVPTEGFVLNKKAGGVENSWSSWNLRKSYVRVYDPRGFEFEIGIDNMLHILDNTNSIKGKGLEGEFVYAWCGAELVLVCCNSPEYKQMKEHNDSIHSGKKLKGKDMILGATYLFKDGNTGVYVGRHNFHDVVNSNYELPFTKYTYKDKGKRYVFAMFDKKEMKLTGHLEWIYTLSTKVVKVVSEDIDKAIKAQGIDFLQSNPGFSPIDYDKTEFVPYTLEEFKELALTDKCWCSFYFFDGDTRQKYKYEVWQEKMTVKKLKSYWSYYNDPCEEHKDYEEVFNKYNPHYFKLFLKNGNFYRKVVD